MIKTRNVVDAEEPKRKARLRYYSVTAFQRFTGNAAIEDSIPEGVRHYRL